VMANTLLGDMRHIIRGSTKLILETLNVVLRALRKELGA